jgi:hypothetical protein
MRNTEEGQLPMLGCLYCKFYHHSEEQCRRLAPGSENVSGMILSVAAALYAKRFKMTQFEAEQELDISRHASWPLVEENDFCGEFLRGSAMTDETLEFQQEKWAGIRDYEARILAEKGTAE